MARASMRRPSSRDKDEYREALMRVIDAKLEGEEVSAPKAARPTKIPDLMAALRASVEVAKNKSGNGRSAAESEDEVTPRRRKKAAAG